MTITIPPELAKRFEELAKQRGTTPEEEFIRKAILKFDEIA
jgi:metal-responsive CopG/Arc/MetJ family transcriptional regulator